MWAWAGGMEGELQTLGFCCSGAHDNFVNKVAEEGPKEQSKTGGWIQEETRDCEWEKGVSYCQLDCMVIVRSLT